MASSGRDSMRVADKVAATWQIACYLPFASVLNDMSVQY
jgi:hypothetical protein